MHKNASDKKLKLLETRKGLLTERRKHLIFMIYKILIVEDEKDIQKLIQYTLERDGYKCLCADNGTIALDIFNNQKLDMVISDIIMPEMDGFNLVREIRRISNIPIIFLTARSDDVSKITGLGFGADNYLVKPISMAELSARVSSQFRRCKVYDNYIDSSNPKIIGCYELREKEGILLIEGVEVPLVAKEFRLMSYLMNNKGKILSKKQIYNAVWEDEYVYDDNTITTTLSRLRSKVETKERKCIQTIRGLGYKFSIL